MHVPVTGVTYTALNDAGGPSGAWVEGPGRPQAEIRARKFGLPLNALVMVVALLVIYFVWMES